MRAKIDRVAGQGRSFAGTVGGRPGEGGWCCVRGPQGERGGHIRGLRAEGVATEASGRFVAISPRRGTLSGPGGCRPCLDQI